MATLPLATAFTDSAVTEGEFKTAITNQREFLAGLLGTDGTKDTALRTLGAFANDVSAKSSNYTVIAADRGVVFNCTSTFTLSLTNAATLGDGFTFAVINSGTGVITIDPNSTEQIDGANTKTITAGAWAIILCNGANFFSMGEIPSSYVGYNFELFETAGVYTWTKPTNVSFVKVTVIGGGAGSGGANTGGQGGYAIAKVFVNTDISVTVGAGGAGLSGGVAGGNGGTSSFGTLVSATGGAGVNGFGTGQNGIGSISSGNALTLSTNTNRPNLSNFLGRQNPKTTGSAENWSATSIYNAGAGGNGINVGGVGGLVLVEW